MIIKRFALFIGLVIFQFNANAQTFEHNYLGEDFIMYKGVYFKLMDDPILGFIYTFYSDLKDCQTENNNNVIYPDIKHHFVTVKDSLANRIFKIENIIDKQGNTWTVNKETSSSDNPIFVLKDSVNGQVIYYKYNTEYEMDFPFNSTKINYSENYFCSKIDKKIDDFTGEVKISSPIMDRNKISSIIIYKNVAKGKSAYYLSLRTSGSTVNVNERGVTILFTDGTKWSKDSKIDVEAQTKDFEYSAFLTLSPVDLVTFSTKTIKKFRLYIYDEEVDLGKAGKFKTYVKCVSSAK